MAVSERAQKARLSLCQCMVDVLRPHSATDNGLSVNERLIAYAIGAGVYSGQPVGAAKLAEMTGVSRSTVRSVVRSLDRRGWIVRLPDKTFDFPDEFHAQADHWFGLDTQYQAILRAGDVLRGLDL